MKSLKIFIILAFFLAVPVLSNPVITPWTGQPEINLFSTTAETVDWVVLDNTPGGPGGLYASWTNLDSAANSDTKWSKTMAGWFGTGKEITLWVYFNAPAADTGRIFIKSRVDDSYTSLVEYVDTLLIVGSASPIATTTLLTLSAYGREYQVVFANVAPTGDGAANASTNDLQIALVPSGDYNRDVRKDYMK